jgi:hypothetical protein
MPLIVSFASQFRRMGATRGAMVIVTVLSLHGLDELVLMATFHEGFIISVPTQTLGSELSQVKPHSTEQLDEHPSPLSVSPSSHVSPPRVFPSPQISLPVGHVVHVD